MPPVRPSRSTLARALGRNAHALALARVLLMKKPGSDLAAPLLDAVALFEELHLRYALVGGLAAMVYGRARFTVDVDFVAQSDHEEAFRAHPDALKRHHFDPKCTWKLYHVSGVEIDIWKDEFADAITRRAATRTLSGTPIRVADPHDLIAMKLRADRPQDDYDISEIVKQTAIRDEVIRSRVTQQQFERFEAIRRRSR